MPIFSSILPKIFSSTFKILVLKLRPLIRFSYLLNRVRYMNLFLFFNIKLQVFFLHIGKVTVISHVVFFDDSSKIKEICF